MNLGERIAALREDSDLTQSELGKEVHISRSAIAGYESGSTQPSYPVLLEIADFFDVSLDYLFGRTKLRCSTRLLAKRLQGEETQMLFDELFSLCEEDRDTAIRVIRALACSRQQEKSE